MLLELLAAAAGITAAVLVLRGATTWFHLYVAVAIALWATMGGTMPVLYGAALDGAVAEVPGLVQGLGWVAVFPLAYLFPDGRFVPRWTRWAAVGWAAYLPTLGVAVLLGYESDPDSPGRDASPPRPVRHLRDRRRVPLPAGVHPGAAAADERRGRGARAVVPGGAADHRDTAARPARAGERRGLAANAGRVPRQLPGERAAACVHRRRGAALPPLRRRRVGQPRPRLRRADRDRRRARTPSLAGLAGLVWHDNDLAAPLAATVVIAVALHPLRLRAQRWVDRFVYGGARSRTPC